MHESIPDPAGSKTSRREFLKKTTAALGGGLAAPLSVGAVDSGKRFDYIIVGAGSSSCVLANRLTEDLSVQVLLLEAGGPDTQAAVHGASRFPAWWGSEVDWQYRAQEEPNLLKWASPEKINS